MEPPRTAGAWRTWARRAAWGWALVAGLVFLWLSRSRGIPLGPEGAVISAATSERLHLVLMGVVIAGLLVAVRLPTLGGFMVAVAAVGLGVLATVEYSQTAAFLAALAFLVPGVLLVVAGRAEGPRAASAAAAVALVALLAAGGVAADRVHDRAFGPFHPVSDTAALPVVSVRWMWSGAVAPRAFTVVARVDDDARSARLVVTGPGGTAVSAPTRPDDRGVVRMRVSGLGPDTDHEYAVEVDGRVDDPRRGHVRTLPEGPASFTVAVASCATTGSNGAVFDEIRRRRPLMFIHTGDLFYANVDTDRAGAFDRPYEATLTSPAQSALYRETPVAYVWDDHDFGTNDSTGDAPSRAAAMAAYRRYVPHNPLALPGPEAPIAQAFTVGRVRFVVTDTRSARTPPDASAPTMLGRDQRDWLVREVSTATARGLLPVWVNPTPWVSAPSPGSDDWGGYDDERRAIVAALRARGVRSLVILSGDAHMAAIDDGTHSLRLADGGMVPVMQAAALDEAGSLKGGPYSEGQVPGSGQFGTIRVEDDGGPEVRVVLEAWNWRGDRLMGLTRTMPVGP